MGNDESVFKIAMDNMLQDWKEESRAANKCIVEILDSYMNLIDQVKRTLDILVKQEEDERKITVTIMSSALDALKSFWSPVLEKSRDTLKEDNDEKSTKAI